MRIRPRRQKRAAEIISGSLFPNFFEIRIFSRFNVPAPSKDNLTVIHNFVDTVGLRCSLNETSHMTGSRSIAASQVPDRKRMGEPDNPAWR